jgi:hypothetical protein
MKNTRIPTLAASVACSLLSLAPPSGAQRDDARAWTDAKAVELRGARATLSEPVLVARSKGYLWFPRLASLSDGRLLALMSDYPDAHVRDATARASWSSDGGLTWTESEAAKYAGSHLRLADGDELLLPHYLFPRADGGMGAPHQVVPKGKQQIQLVKEGVAVTGWPRPDRSLQPKLGLSGFVFNGQAVPLQGGGWLATLYGYFQDAKRYSLVAAESTDGVAWKVRSTVADEECQLPGGEGPSEAALCRLKGGRLLCVFRLAAGARYGQCWSDDEGKTWTEPAGMADAGSVQPSLAVLPDGAVALSGGRDGLFLWLDLAGDGRGWQRIDVRDVHNAARPREPIDKADHTSSYTGVVALDEMHLLYIYDRIPSGWGEIPKDSAEANGVWVIRVALERSKE